ncbi:hypothetical protein [Legionella rowbothamii]|uniref:hypothetical protein n=1 Tax=Legionella rowbothamii TaxID=96229 RepID=UPI001056223F|nr:hypothetical protein [Legionella rowbothamii]
MAAEKNELARLTAKDGTHDFAHSASVAAGLMALERRYGFKVTEKEREVVVNNQINKTRCLEEDSLNDTYLACHQEMFRALNLAKDMPEFAHLQPLITRLEAKLPEVFPKTMVTEAYQWEQMDNIVLNPSTREIGSRIFPLHYVFIVIWTALNDDRAFIGNYSPNGPSAPELAP